MTEHDQMQIAANKYFADLRAAIERLVAGFSDLGIAVNRWIDSPDGKRFMQAIIAVNVTSPPKKRRRVVGQFE